MRGPTVCEVIHQGEVDEIVARLGPDPLRRAADPNLAWARISKSRRPIGALLMDQKVIAGVGNVYRSDNALTTLKPPCWTLTWWTIDPERSRAPVT